MATWTQATGSIEVLDADGRPIAAREDHHFEWSISAEATSVRHLSPHRFVFEKGKEAHAVAVYFDNAEVAMTYALPGRPVKGRLDIGDLDT